MKKLIATTSMFALMLAAPALAQTSETPANESSKPTIEQPSQPEAMPAEGKSMTETTAEKSADEKSMTETTAEKPADEKSMTETAAEKPADDKSMSEASAEKPAGDASMTNANVEKPAIDTVATADGQHWRATSVIGQSVRNSENETVGDINDIVLSSDGTIEHILVGVGGFLGLGEKVVALKYDELSFVKNDNGTYLISTTATKESLETASEWKEDKAK